MLTINTSASGTGETSGRTRRAGSGETSETSGLGVVRQVRRVGLVGGMRGLGVVRQVGRVRLVKGNRFL